MEKIQSKPPKENQLLSLLFNIVIPVVIMTKFNGTEGALALGPKISLLVAISFPICYAIVHYVRTRQVNFISILGFVSILLTGVLGTKEGKPLLLAIKEASVPLIIAIVVFLSIKINRSVVSSLLFNEDIVDMPKVYSVLDERGKREEFEKMFRKSSYWVVVSFLLSSVLNFTLARIILKSQPGTVSYTEEIGKLTGLSFPIIAVPCTIILVIVMFYIFKQITKMTDIPLEELVKTDN